MKLFIVEYLSEHNELWSEEIYAKSKEEALIKFKRYKLKVVSIYQLR